MGRQLDEGTENDTSSTHTHHRRWLRSTSRPALRVYLWKTYRGLSRNLVSRCSLALYALSMGQQRIGTPTSKACRISHSRSASRLIGFEELGNADDFNTAVLEMRLAQSGMLKSHFKSAYHLIVSGRGAAKTADCPD